MAQQYQSEHNSLQASFAEPAAVAEQIYDAIYREIREIGMPPRRAMEVDRAIAILAERPLAQRQKVAAAFSEAYRLTLEQVFLQVGRADQRVNALALLNFPANNYATDMARALVGSGVRDDFAVETLYKADRAHRYVLEQEYNLAFWALGKGSLRADIKDKLSGWHEAKALILLDRDLTPADEIYFLSTGITLTKSKELIKLLYAEWYKGPRSFHQLVRQWDELLVKPGWATEGLSDAMSSDVWNDNFTTSRANVNLIFNTYAEWKRMGLDADPSEPASRRDRLTGEALTWEEENLTLHVARESLKLSLSFNAYSDDHFAEAVRAIRDVWTQRILREEEAGRKAEAKRRWEEWKLARKQVLDEIAAHNIRFGTDSREYARAQFMLMEMIGAPG
ncbi:MAG TPA: hypothetical protein VNT75_25620, partial [Symbiobacteriaceae bacterium]|nr:hypothetical protein [Symbiobacteriaceae bacterium]